MKNQELIKYLDKIIEYVEENLEQNSLYLCTMYVDLGLSKGDKINPEYLKFLKANKPTSVLHSSFYKHKNFDKRADSYSWWIPLDGKLYDIPHRVNINKQKLLFIKHLKEQLEQGIINP